MVAEKSYSGSVVTTSTGTRSELLAYGLTNTVTVQGAKTDLINSCLEEFLLECGVDAEYDGNFIWMNGVPFHVYSTGANYYLMIANAYSTTVSSSSSGAVVFSNGAYNFKLRFVGNPDSAFFVLVSTNATAPVFSGAIGNFFVGKARSVLDENKEKLFLARNGSVSSPSTVAMSCYLHKTDGEGAIGPLVRDSNYTSSGVLSSHSEDFAVFPGKFPLVKTLFGVYTIDDVFMVPDNAGIVTTTASSATTYVYEIDGHEYLSVQRCLIKCS